MKHLFFYKNVIKIDGKVILLLVKIILLHTFLWVVLSSGPQTFLIAQEQAITKTTTKTKQSLDSQIVNCIYFWYTHTHTHSRTNILYIYIIK